MTPGADPKLSAAVIAQNCAPEIGACVDSLGFADEVVVVDAFSEDGTDQVAREHGARVVRNAWPGFSRQWTQAIASCRGTWVIVCASDERVTPALAESIRDALARGGPEEGFTVRRRNHFLGVAIHHGRWARDRSIRVFRREAARVDDAPVHEGIHVDGAVGNLDGDLLHYTHPTLAASIERANRYTSLEAGGRIGGRRVYLVEAFVAPVRTFVGYYVRGGLWRYGIPGYLLAATTAIYRSFLYLKTYLLQHEGDDETVRV